MIKRPARLTHLGKNKGFPANQKGSGKNKGWKWKIIQPATRKPEKAAWAKEGIPMDWKPERAVQAKIRDLSVRLCPGISSLSYQKKICQTTFIKHPHRYLLPQKLGNNELSKWSGCPVHRSAKVSSAEECDQDTFTPCRANASPRFYLKSYFLNRI